MSTASKLEEAEHKVQALQTGLAPLFWPIAMMGLEVRGERSFRVSGLCVNQLLQARRDPAELGCALWIGAAFGLHALCQRWCCSQSIGKYSEQSRAWSTYSIRASLQLQQAIELFIRVVFCSGFTCFWTRINTCSGLGSVWTQFPPVCLACCCDLLAMNFQLCILTDSRSGHIWFRSLWEHKKFYSLNYCSKYFKWISSLASLMRN